MSGALRCVFRTNVLNHAPRSPMNRTGEVDELTAVCELSLPRGERPMPQTKFARLARLSASYAAASARPQTCADSFCPAEPHCGLRKSGWLHSFMTTNWCTVGKAAATCPVQPANSSILPVLPHAVGSADGWH